MTFNAYARRHPSCNYGHAPTRSKGFTLAEILIAMTILVVAATGVYNISQQTTLNNIKLQDKTMAHWVASNKMVELRALSSWPPVGRKEENVDMAGRQWTIKTEVKQQTAELRRVDIRVNLRAEIFEDDTGSLLTLSSFFGEL